MGNLLSPVDATETALFELVEREAARVAAAIQFVRTARAALLSGQAVDNAALRAAYDVIERVAPPTGESLIY